MIESSHNNELSSYDLERHGQIRNSIESIQADVDKIFEGIKELINRAEVELLTPNREFLNGVIESYRDLCNAVTDFQKLKVTTESSQLNESFNNVINQEERFNRAVKLLNNELAKTVSANVGLSDVPTPDLELVSKNKEKRYQKNKIVSNPTDEIGPVVVTEGQPVNRAGSLSDLGKLAGLDSIVRKLTAEEEEQLQIQQSKLTADRMGIGEESGAEPTFNTPIVREGFDNDQTAFTGAEVLESDILQSSQAPNYAKMGKRLNSFEAEPEHRPELSVELYRRWQSGDPTLFEDNWWHHFDTITHDVSIMMIAAGYDKAAVDQIGKELLKPWMDKVNAKRQGKDPETRFNVYRDELLDSVRGLLVGKAPNPAVFVESKEQTIEPAVETTPKEGDILPSDQSEVVGEAAGSVLVPNLPEQETLIGQETPETKTESPLLEMKEIVSTEDVDRSLERARLTFMDYREKFLSRGPQNIPELGVGDMICSQLDNFHELDAAVAFNKKSKYLKTLTGVNEALERITAQEAYAEARFERAEAREAFVGARDAYYTALREFYEGKVDAQGEAVAEKQQGGRRLAYKVREFFGSDVELPPHLKELKDQHDLLQMEYALKLNEALFARAESNENNREYNSLQDEGTKKAFAKRFIVKSALATRVAREGEKKESSKFVSLIKRSAAHLRDHKWMVRSGLLVGYGFLGLATGGLGAAVLAGGRVAVGMAAGAAGGAAGGTLGQLAFKRSVDTAKATVDKTLAAQTEALSFSNFASAQEEYGKAYGALRRKEIMQGTAGIAGALVGGFVAGRGTAEAFSEVVGGGAPEVSAVKGEAMVSTFQAEDVVADQPLIKTSVVTVGRFGPNGVELPGVAVRGISLEGARVSSLSDGTIAEADKMVPQVIERLHLAVKDLLEARPNLPKSEVERIVFEKLQAKYSGEVWWKEAGITKLSIDSLEVVPTTSPVSETMVSTDPILSSKEPVTTQVDAIIPEPAPESVTVPKPEAVTLVEHTVQSGETLGGIIKQEYAEVLKDLPPAEQNRVLGTLFDKVRMSTDLRDSIGLRDGNVDRIYPGETLALDKLGAELKSIIDAGPARPLTGTVAVDASLGSDVETITINNSVRSPIDEAYIDKGAINGYMEESVFDRNARTSAEMVAAETRSNVYNPPRPPQEFLLSGKYFESPTYANFLKENGFTTELIKDATNKFAVEFEGKTYGWLNELLQNFDSPYKELGKITVKEMDEIATQAGDSEEALRSLLAEKAPDKTFNLPTIRTWGSLIDAIRQSDKIAFNENTPLSDLVQRYVAEQMIKNNYDQAFKAANK